MDPVPRRRDDAEAGRSGVGLVLGAHLPGAAADHGYYIQHSQHAQYVQHSRHVESSPVDDGAAPWSLLADDGDGDE